MGTRSSATHKRPERASKANRPPIRKLLWLWISIFAGLLVIGGAAIVLANQPAVEAGGVLTAERTFHDFGQVRIGGGLITTNFPLAVEGSPLVTELSTT